MPGHLAHSIQADELADSIRHRFPRVNPSIVYFV